MLLSLLSADCPKLIKMDINIAIIADTRTSIIVIVIIITKTKTAVAAIAVKKPFRHVCGSQQPPHDNHVMKIGIYWNDILVVSQSVSRSVSLVFTDALHKPKKKKVHWLQKFRQKKLAMTCHNIEEFWRLKCYPEDKCQRCCWYGWLSGGDFFLLCRLSVSLSVSWLIFVLIMIETGMKLTSWSIYHIFCKSATKQQTFTVGTI